MAFDDELFAMIGPLSGPPERRLCEPRRLPGHVSFQWLDDAEGLRERTCDGRGNRLTYITSGELAAIPAALSRGLSGWNRAVFQLLQQLNAETPVVLFWE